MFLSVDPLIVPSDPQSANAYTYARNNPISNTDPTGMICQTNGCVGSAGATSFLMGQSSSGIYGVDTSTGKPRTKPPKEYVWGAAPVGGAETATSAAAEGSPPSNSSNQSQSHADTGPGTGAGPTLTEAEHAQAEQWAKDARIGINEVFGDGSHRAPRPKNWEINSLTVSRTQPPGEPGLRARNLIGARETIGGRLIQSGDITIYPAGAGSFESVFVRLGHEIGHFFPEGTFTEAQLTQYGQGLWNVHQNGGVYSGPRP